MNAAHLHLMIVHLPVVGALAAGIILLVGHILRQELLYKLGYGFLIGCALGVVVAYLSGQAAYEFLQESYPLDEKSAELVESHGILGRASMIGLLLLGAACLNACLQYLQGERPPFWLQIVILVGLVVMLYLLAWTSHQGGMIRHPEICGDSLPIFPPSDW